jgi:SagB-type dehydrogenase family enzyme
MAFRPRHTAACALFVLALASGTSTAGEPGMIDLPSPSLAAGAPLNEALAARRSTRSFSAAPLPLPSVAQLLWSAQGVTHPDGLRTAPSAGALYPLELYLLAGAVQDLEAGVYRYRPADHRLQPSVNGDLRAELADAALGQDWIREAPAALVIAGVYERTGRKYGARAQRYVHIETGHVAQNVLLQALALGLGGTPVGAFDDSALQRLLQLPADQQPLLVIPLGVPR